MTATRPRTWLLALLTLPALGTPTTAAEPSLDPAVAPLDSALVNPPPPPIRWDPDWPTFSSAETWATGIFGAVALSTYIFGPFDQTPGGRGILFDEGARDLLRFPDERNRRIARDISDGLLTFMVAYPHLVDALIVTGWHHQREDIAEQMVLMNLEAQAITLGLQAILNVTVSRERPFGRVCGTELNAKNRDCETPERYRSFFSGHTSQTFASAALTCSHHMALGLYQDEFADAMACVGSFGLATATGLLRVLGDQHYVSDVLVGAVVGTLVGFGVPWLFHYGHGDAADDDEDEDRGDPDDFKITVMPTPNGAAAVGVF